ncbi:MAG: N-6 DNA methylase, partial [Syntrophus sp. (in: bacteria)]
DLPTRGGKARPLSKEDFSQKGAIFLQEKAQFDYLVSLTDDKDRAREVINAMESIETDYETLRGVLPKGEYQELDNEVLGQLLRTLDPDELRTASGDIFGRIYEYFLTQFADLKAHDGGEFFTPISLVSLIANVIEPERGIVLDPACGSGGMFVQSAHFVEHLHANPSERLTFYGLEKNPTTIRLAKMNLAVHGLEGDIQKAITYYEDPHELYSKADFVMANPPFNVDEVDADKVKRDPRLPFGLPGVSKKGKVSNGNYLWISYFYSYLNEKGRAGFVMSSQASSAGRDEAKVRQKLIETGNVDIMISIRSNFFYTRTVPCELWFLNKSKSEEQRDKVLMLDARNIYRKVTRKIYDFSPEQLQNILAIVWLYRGQKERFLDLMAGYLDKTIKEGYNCFAMQNGNGATINLLEAFHSALKDMQKAMQPFLDSLTEDHAQTEAIRELNKSLAEFDGDVKFFHFDLESEGKKWSKQARDNAGLKETTERLAVVAEASRDVVKQADLIYKLICREIDTCENEQSAKESGLWSNREVVGLRKAADEARQVAVDQLKKVRYFHKQVAWLTGHFPDAELKDVEGLVKLVSHSELADNDWSLTPGRYVGVAPEEEDENFDFEDTVRNIH